MAAIDHPSSPEQIKALLDDLSARLVELPADRRESFEADLQKLRAKVSDLAASHPANAARSDGETDGARDRALSRAVEHSPVSIVITGPDGSIEYVNPKFTRLTGYTLEEARGQNPRILKSGQTPPEAYRKMWQTILSGETWQGEFCNVKKNGELYWEQASISAIYGEDGQIAHFVAVKEDITQRKQAAEALQRSEAKYRTTLDSIGDAVITTDPHGRVNFLNPVAEYLTGWTSAQAAGQPLEQVLYVIDEQTGHPAPNPIEKVLELGRVVEFPDHTALVARDGRIIPVEDSAAPIQDDEGQTLGVVIVFHDVTEKRNAARALQDSHQRTLEILESINDGFFELDRDWRFTYINQRAAGNVGRAPEELIGKNVWETFPTIAGTMHERFYRQVMDQREPAFFEMRGELTARSYSIRIYPSSRGITVYWIDVTESKQAEDRIRRQNAVLAGINRIFQEALICETDEELGRVCLTVAEEVTQSKFGFLGEINRETNRLDDIAVSDPGWDACQMPDKPERGEKIAPGFPVHGLYGMALLEGKGFFTNDPASHPDSAGTPPGHPALRAFLGVPLAYGEQVIGMVGLGNRPGGYNADTLEAALALAPAIVQALRNKRGELALRSSEEKYRELFATMQESFLLLEVITGDQDQPVDFRCLDVNPAAQRFLKLARTELVGHTYREVMRVIDPQMIELVGRVALSREPEAMEFFSKNTGRWLSYRLFSPRPRQAALFFTDIHEQKRLETEQREHAMQMEIQRRLMEQREQDRQAIARDIHDGPVQTLSGTAFNLQFVKEAYPDPALRVELEQIGLNVKDAIQELRQVINELRPPSLIRFGLAKTIQVHTEEIRERYPRTHWDLQLEDDDNLFPEHVNLTLFRIYQEAVINVLRHAGASQGWVYFCLEETSTENQLRAILEIRDNGKGFPGGCDLSSFTQSGHYGLAGMKERAEAIGGQLTILSGPGGGTTIRVTLPVQRKRA